MYIRTRFLTIVCTFFRLYVIIFVHMLFFTYTRAFLHMYIITYESENFISHESM